MIMSLNSSHKAKVGVVVPIWNVAPYIERCVESLMKQTLDDMQFVFVDDASPDNSFEILNKVLSRYPNRLNQVVVLRHTTNKGLPSARKTGLEAVSAEYVVHCDGDDWIEPTMYEKMYLTACKNDADMVVCEKIPQRRLGEIDDNYLLAFLHREISSYVWKRMTRTEIYNHITFPTDNLLEDWVQGVQIHAYSKIVSFIDEPFLYHYTDNPNSITRSSTADNCDQNLSQAMANMKLVHDFVIPNNLAREEDLVFMKIQVRKRLEPKLLRRQGRLQYLRTYPEINRSLFNNRWVPWYFKVEHIAIKLN